MEDSDMRGSSTDVDAAAIAGANKRDGREPNGQERETLRGKQSNMRGNGQERETPPRPPESEPPRQRAWLVWGQQGFPHLNTLNCSWRRKGLGRGILVWRRLGLTGGGCLGDAVVATSFGRQGA